MDDKLLKYKILNTLAEQGIPANYDPWKAVQKRFEGNRSSQDKPVQFFVETGEKSRSRIRLAGMAVLLLIIFACGIYLTTPQGRAMAQGILQFFLNAESNTLSLPTGQPTEFIPPTRTVVPTRKIGLQKANPEDTAVGGSGFVTPTPISTSEYKTSFTGLTLAEAESLAKYKVSVPDSLPSGYTLEDVSYNQQTQSVQQVSKFNPYHSGEMFILDQELSLSIDTIGQNAEVNHIRVGTTVVEWVNGSWFASPGAVQEEWDLNAPIHTFRWQQGDFYFTLQFWINDSFSPAYLSVEDMQALIEIIIGTRATFPEKLDLNNLTSVEEAERATGFNILEPSILPEGYRFSHAAYEPEGKRVVLIYQPEISSRASSGANLVVFETIKATPQAPLSWEGFPPQAVEQVVLGTIPATFVRGAIVDGLYDPEFGLALIWDSGELYITLRFHYSSSYPVRLEKADMITIGESFH